MACRADPEVAKIT
ncbi:hypothetical protein YPPY47_0490, partial [Yersinia pestis PY-47]